MEPPGMGFSRAVLRPEAVDSPAQSLREGPAGIRKEAGRGAGPGPGRGAPGVPEQQCQGRGGAAFTR